MHKADEWALITGASSGIGLAFAEKFAANGINLILTARDEAALQKIAERLEEEYKIVTLVIAADLTDSAAVAEVVQRMDQQRIQPKYFINNAGIGSYGEFTAVDWQREQALLEVNVAAATQLLKLITIRMAKQGGGHVVNLASVAAFFPGPKMAVYYASKAYLLHLSEALSEELKDKGVYVMALCPGPTATSFSKTAEAENSSVFRGKLPTAEQVVDYGYRAMLKKRRVAVHGWRNRLSLLIIRFLPRRVVVRLVAFVQR